MPIKLNKSLTTLFVLAFILSMACSNAESKNKVSEKTKSSVSTAKDFTLTLLDGNKLSLSDLKGKVAILDVWDTWCPPCKAEIPHFIELYDQYRDKGFVMVGVVGGRNGKAAVEQFIKDYKINYLNGLFNEEFNMNYGPIQSIPTTFVLDKNGNIYKKYIGYTEKSVFENDIKTLLGI